MPFLLWCETRVWADFILATLSLTGQLLEMTDEHISVEMFVFGKEKSCASQGHYNSPCSNHSWRIYERRSVPVDWISGETFRTCQQTAQRWASQMRVLEHLMQDKCFYVFVNGRKVLCVTGNQRSAQFPSGVLGADRHRCWTHYLFVVLSSAAPSEPTHHEASTQTEATSFPGTHSTWGSLSRGCNCWWLVSDSKLQENVRIVSEVWVWPSEKWAEASFSPQKMHSC